MLILTLTIGPKIRSCTISPVNYLSSKRQIFVFLAYQHNGMNDIKIINNISEIM